MFYFSKIFLKLLRMNNKFIYSLAFLFILLSAISAYMLEKETFGSVFNGLWWVMTTVTTTGYGDYTPKTVAGKCLGLFLYVFGIGLISVTISKVIDSLFVYRQRKEAGKLRYQGEQHFVIISWSKNAELAIQEILNTDTSTEVVLIDTLEKTPIVHNRVHYIRGIPTHMETLEMANMEKARSVFVFANEITEEHAMLRDPSFVDGKTLLIATTIERSYRNVHSIVEIKNSENMQNFQHVNVNEFILGSETISQLAVRSAFSPGSSRIVSQLLTRQSSSNLQVLRKRSSWRTYRDAFEQLLLEGATLISDRDQLNINQKLDQLIPEDAQLFVICDTETYERVSKLK
ncbi:potassium channel family protein [Paenibacillus chondroitinus]|uniref:Potassium channel family protein n=1 Tax=Paenibacillus chondroitinus TaxID=59842 RepID=A0ABU6D6A9_9BACL|nr:MULTISPECIES: potassium channel family protein [Paenibacillus]MCY9657846.1 potassium channel family protein [Paenibacillus anseongense]MEB4793258.1 potassium channel family protein [Paenibacillus chondroitinus]